MPIFDQLNKLRGIKQEEPQPVQTAAPRRRMITPSDPLPTATGPSVKVSDKEQVAPKLPEPVEISCKNYTDEKGHFAYIDANTKQIIHVNLDNGKVYTKEEVNQLSFKQSLSHLPSEYQNLTWQEVINKNTLYDEFGSPVFMLDEINAALNKNVNAQNEGSAEEKTGTVIENNTSNTPKTDPWGFPL